MNKSIKILFVLVLILLSCSKDEKNFHKENSIKDDIGNIIVIEKPPRKIITLAPNLTEMIFDLKLEKYLIGNTLYCNYPEEAKKIDKVGDMQNYDFEKILTLKPDLIFITVEGNTKETYDKFKELRLKIFVSNPRNIAGIKKTYLDIAKIFGVESFAKKRISTWDSITNNIINSSKKYKRKKAMFIVELNPIMLAGKNTFINEYLETCALTNLASDSKLNYPVFSREEILKRNPDYIIVPSNGYFTPKKILELYPEWKNLNAFKNNNVITVNADLFVRPGPRYAEALKELFILLHPQEKFLH